MVSLNENVEFVDEFCVRISLLRSLLLKLYFTILNCDMQLGDLIVDTIDDFFSLFLF